MNPFWGTHFFSFFQVLFSRLFTWNYSVLTTDEIQIGTMSCIAICCGLIGPFLVLRKMTMFANSLSHTILLGIVISFLLLGGAVLSDYRHLFVGALIAAILTAILTEGLVKWFRLTEDASVGLVFTVLFAAGIVLSTLFLKDVHLGIESVIGNADALQLDDLRHAFVLVLLNAATIFIFYRQFQISSFDANLAKVLGIPEGMFRFILLFLVSATCMGAFRAIGVLLVLAFLVGPYLTARLFCHRLKSLLFYSGAMGVLATICGVAFARHLLSEWDLALSTGGIVVCFIGFFYFLALLLKACLKRKGCDIVIESGSRIWK
jgi:manganese/zinc/iron transport system permease protein